MLTDHIIFRKADMIRATKRVSVFIGQGHARAIATDQNPAGPGGQSFGSSPAGLASAKESESAGRFRLSACQQQVKLPCGVQLQLYQQCQSSFFSACIVSYTPVGTVVTVRSSRGTGAQESRRMSFGSSTTFTGARPGSCSRWNNNRAAVCPILYADCRTTDSGG